MEIHEQKQVHFLTYLQVDKQEADRQAGRWVVKQTAKQIYKNPKTDRQRDRYENQQTETYRPTDIQIGGQIGRKAESQTDTQEC